MISHVDFAKILIAQEWQMLSLCLLFPTYTNDKLVSLLLTFLLSPDEVLKPFSKQHFIERVLDLINKWNPICPLLYPPPDGVYSV